MEKASVRGGRIGKLRGRSDLSFSQNNDKGMPKKKRSKWGKRIRKKTRRGEEKNKDETRKECCRKENALDGVCDVKESGKEKT